MLDPTWPAPTMITRTPDRSYTCAPLRAPAVSRFRFRRQRRRGVAGRGRQRLPRGPDRVERHPAPTGEEFPDIENHPHGFLRADRRPRMAELETEAEKTRAEIASYLRDLADQLDGSGDVTLDLGGTTV